MQVSTMEVYALKKISSIIPYVFEGRLIIALHSDWITLFGKIPTFRVFIAEKRLHMISEEIISK